MGPRDPAPPVDGLNGPPAPDGHGVHVVGPRGTYANTTDTSDSHFYADSTCATCRITLLSVGRLVPKKGFDGLLQALALLPADLDWRLRHVGGGPLKDGLAAEADRLGIGSRIEWLGARPQEQVLEEYRGADLFVLNCRIAEDGDRDGLPNVLMEAQSQRLPVISTAMPAIAELVIDGETGLLTPPDDPARLAEAVARLLRDPTLRAQYAGAGFQRVRSLFSATEGIDDLERRFRKDLPAARAAFEAADSE